MQSRDKKMKFKHNNVTQMSDQQKIKKNKGGHPRNVSWESKVKKNDIKEKSIKIKSSIKYRNRRIYLCDNDIVHLRSPKHKNTHACKENCKKILLLDCKVVIKKLNLKNLIFANNDIYVHKTDNQFSSTYKQMLNCRVVVNKLNLNNLKNTKVTLEKKSKPKKNYLDGRLPENPKTEIKTEQALASQSINKDNCSSSGLLPDSSRKEPILFPNLAPEELISGIKNEPVDEITVSHLHLKKEKHDNVVIKQEKAGNEELDTLCKSITQNIPVENYEVLISQIKNEPLDEITVSGSLEHSEKEKLENIVIKQEKAENEELDTLFKSNTTNIYVNNCVPTTIGENNLKKIKSEPSKNIGVQNKQMKNSNQGKLKGVLALRERLHMFTSEKQIKQEHIRVDEIKESTIDSNCNADQKNDHQKRICITKSDVKVKESIDNHKDKQSNEAHQAVTSMSQNGGIVNDVSLSHLECNGGKNCSANVAPTKQISLNRLCEEKMDTTEMEKTNNLRNIQTNNVSYDILPCGIESGIVENKSNLHADWLYVKNLVAELFPLPGYSQKKSVLSTFWFSHIETLVCHEKFVFLNGKAVQCKYLLSSIKVQFDGICNKKDGKLIPFVIWHGVKPRMYNNQLFSNPLVVDYFDVFGKCTIVDKMLRIHIDTFRLTLECSNIVSSFLNSNGKSLVIPHKTPVNIYLRRYDSPYNKPKWIILWMVLHVSER